MLSNNFTTQGGLPTTRMTDALLFSTIFDEL